MKALLPMTLCNLLMCISAQFETEAPCDPSEENPLYVTEGEAVRVPLLSDDREDNHTEYVWHNDNMQEIGTSEVERVHHHRGQLYFLPVLLNDSGVFRRTSGKCEVLLFNIKVIKAEPFGWSVLYLPIKESAVNPSITCPNDMWEFCEDVRGKFTWHKDFRQIPKESGEKILIVNASKQDEGVYTCRCTWEHGGRIFNSSASRKLEIKDPSATYAPWIRSPVNHTSETAQPGSQVRLVCSVFFGFNVQDLCTVWWVVNESSVQDLNRETNGSTDCGQSAYIEETFRNNEHNVSIYSTMLTICKVSEEHFRTKFKCIAMNSNKWDFVFVSLKNPETMYTSLVVNLTLLGVFILLLGTLKLFLVDLVLLARAVLKTCHCHRHEDGKVFDAYVIYQRQNVGKAASEKICHFVEKVLPQELEQKCGYRLFILGRDDLPGEDSLELVPTRVRLSRRLLIILTPVTEGGCGSSISDMYGAPAGLAVYQALVQDELKVILIQLQGTGVFDHLPGELQHLIRKSAPLLWEERGYASRRFWKRIQYMMLPPP